MKKYKVKINGKTYNVVLEEVKETNESIVREADSKVEVSNVQVSDGEYTSVNSPIQGNILEVLVSVGQKITKGTPVAIIEAMKLENEVNSPSDGEVVEVCVSKGQNVTSNQLLVKIR